MVDLLKNKRRHVRQKKLSWRMRPKTPAAAETLVTTETPLPQMNATMSTILGNESRPTENDVDDKTKVISNNDNDYRSPLYFLLLFLLLLFIIILLFHLHFLLLLLFLFHLPFLLLLLYHLLCHLQPLILIHINNILLLNRSLRIIIASLPNLLCDVYHRHLGHLHRHLWFTSLPQRPPPPPPMIPPIFTIIRPTANQ